MKTPLLHNHHRLRIERDTLLRSPPQAIYPFPPYSPSRPDRSAHQITYPIGRLFWQRLERISTQIGNSEIMALSKARPQGGSEGPCLNNNAGSGRCVHKLVCILLNGEVETL